MLRRYEVVPAFAVALLLAPACSQRTDRTDTAAAAVVVAHDTTGAAVAVAAPADVPVELQVATPPGTGVILTDASGRAVYVLDGPCTGDCASQFTPVTGHAAARAGDTTLKSSMLGGTTGAGGASQATYNGQRLYYFTGDKAAGDTKGQGVTAGGATAHLVGANGSAAGPARSGKK